ncbi:hypothetical protein SAMN05660649_04786 [Desulfotomaculum arcticum]|uniref:Uncharacterized protein n=1 Tax=Desulfotruncus arcticus DSM 17038 TaxID=1121424 RepID=A0A1I2Z6T8_9FIRM|nr:hypothetical protein [Desulfotruncus arcticus]SFH33577.1 hypothetical protein SAMN05660649_04786 [Desulfotomaculum arcticum] [Desulfotruncus arcticus DSM 17038]
MPNQKTMEIFMRLLKITTGNKACFKDNLDRVGKLYLPLPLLDKMNISDEITVQLAPGKKDLPASGYVTKVVFQKTTTNKIRFVEDITERGELVQIYISKSILEDMGLQDNLAVRVISAAETGGATVAR